MWACRKVPHALTKLVIISSRLPASESRATQVLVDALQFFMRVSAVLMALTVLAASALAQNVQKPESRAGSKSVTIPVALDHDRVVIYVYLPLPDGSTKPIRGWVDNGDPDLWMSRNAATLMGLAVSCSDKECSAPPPAAVKVGDMQIPLTVIKQVRIPLKPPNAASIMVPGMSAGDQHTLHHPPQLRRAHRPS